MAKKLKTIEYAFPSNTLTAVNNTLTTLQPILLELPEYAKNFKSVTALLSCDDVITATGGTMTSRRISLQTDNAAISSSINTQTYTNSGENISLFHSANFTNYFVANYGPDSASLGVTGSYLVNQSTGTTLGMANGVITLTITYEYEPTASVRQAKTAYIPMNALVGNYGTSKPGTAVDILPTLNTYCLEVSKSFTNVHIVTQGNIGSAGAVTHGMQSYQLNNFTAFTSSLSCSLATDRWYRAIYVVPSNIVAAMATASLSWYTWSTIATRFPHQQSYAVVTYTFQPSISSQSLNTMILPMELNSPFGGTTSADYQRGQRGLFIQEPGNIINPRVAFYCFFEQAAAIAGMQARIGTGSFVAYTTDSAASLAGSNGLMHRNDTSCSLNRGRNSLNFDVYRTDTSDLGWNASGFWIVNYGSLIASGGIDSHNKTIIWNKQAINTNAASLETLVPANASPIPADNWFISAIGTRYYYITNSTGNAAGVAVSVERLTDEGGIAWESVYKDVGHTDPETGLRQCWSQIRELAYRWDGDPQGAFGDRIKMLDRARRYRLTLGNAATSFDHFDLIWTYHSIQSAVSASVTGSLGGTVNLGLHRANNGELVATGSRTGDGDYYFVWYDDTEPMYVEAYKDNTYVGRSGNFTASFMS